jgi:hypothetical protein
MSASKSIFAAFSILVIGTLACGVNVDLGTSPAGTPTFQRSGLNQISTIVAQTLQAYTQQAPTSTPTPTPTGTPLPTFTATTLTVSADTTCYAGPATNYGMVITLHPGTIAVVIGKNTAANYWEIQVPNYPGSLCWLSGVSASVSGDSSNLPEATPVPNIYTLSEPKSLNVSCSSQPISSSSHHHSWDHWDHGDHNASDWTVYFHWKNTEPNQTGVRVYRNGRLVATLGGHASSYTDEFRHENHHYTATMGVQAFNGSAVSSIVTIDVRHCSGD